MIEQSPLLPEPGPPGLSPSEVFHLASFSQRLMGRIIDVLLTGAPAFLLFALARNSGRFSWFWTPYLLSLAFSFMNDVVLTTVKGGTIGKLVVGTRVVHLPERTFITTGIAGRRWAAMTVLEMIPFLGIVDSLWIFTGQMRQTLHDKFAETIVVRSRAA